MKISSVEEKKQRPELVTPSVDELNNKNLFSNYLLEAADCLGSGKPLSEKTKSLLIEHCMEEGVGLLLRDAEPGSRARRELAKKRLILIVSGLWFNFDSLDTAITMISGTIRETLAAEGYQVQDDASLKKLFTRADDELNNGAVQKYHLWLKEQCKKKDVEKCPKRDRWEIIKLKNSRTQV